MKDRRLFHLSCIFVFLLFIPAASAFTLSGSGYRITGNTGHGGISASGSYSTSALSGQPVGRISANGQEVCLGPLCRRLIPVMGPVITFLGDAIKSRFSGGETVSVRVNVSSFVGKENIQATLINITDPNLVLRVRNGSMENTSSVTKGYTYTYSQHIKASDVGGVWSMKVMTASRHGFRVMKQGNFTVYMVPMKLWIELKREGLNETVYIPGAGEVPASELESEEYTSPEHFYIVSYSNESLYGLVFFHEEPLILAVQNGTNNYSLKLVDNLTHSNVFLLFSRGSWREVENRMALVESKQFLQKPAPTFGYGLGSLYPVDVMLLYSGIDVRGNDTIQKGYHSMEIRSNKTDSQKAVIVGRE